MQHTRLAVELRLPIAELLREPPASSHCAATPHSRRTARRAEPARALPCNRGCIELGELVDEHAQGPAIGHDVVACTRTAHDRRAERARLTRTRAPRSSRTPPGGRSAQRSRTTRRPARLGARVTERHSRGMLAWTSRVASRSRSRTSCAVLRSLQERRSARQSAARSSSRAAARTGHVVAACPAPLREEPQALLCYRGARARDPADPGWQHGQSIPCACSFVNSSRDSLGSARKRDASWYSRADGVVLMSRSPDR